MKAEMDEKVKMISVISNHPVEFGLKGKMKKIDEFVEEKRWRRKKLEEKRNENRTKVIVHYQKKKKKKLEPRNLLKKKYN